MLAEYSNVGVRASNTCGNKQGYRSNKVKYLFAPHSLTIPKLAPLKFQVGII